MKALLAGLSALAVALGTASATEAAAKAVPAGKFGGVVKIGSYGCYPTYGCYPKVYYPPVCHYPPVYVQPVYPVHQVVYVKKIYFAPMQCEIFFVPHYKTWCYLHPVLKTYVPLHGMSNLPPAPIEAGLQLQQQGLQQQGLPIQQGLQQQGQLQLPQNIPAPPPPAPMQ